MQVWSAKARRKMHVSNGRLYFSKGPNQMEEQLGEQLTANLGETRHHRTPWFEPRQLITEIGAPILSASNQESNALSGKPGGVQ